MAIRLTKKSLDYVVAVVESSSIVKASEKVRVALPTISEASSQIQYQSVLQPYVRKHD